MELLLSFKILSGSDPNNIFVSFLSIHKTALACICSKLSGKSHYQTVPDKAYFHHLPFHYSAKQNFCCTHLIAYLVLTCIGPPHGKTNNVVSEQVRHKPACKSIEN